MENSFFQRIIRASKLDTSLYEEVEADASSTNQAIGVVVLSAVAAGIGTSGAGLAGIVFVTLAALASWYVWAFLTYWIGTRVLPEPGTHATHGELLRTIGFSSSPGILRVLGVVPGLQSLLFFVSAIWMLVAMIVAVRTALDYQSTWRAVGVCAIGWVVQAIVLAIVFSLMTLQR